MHSHFKDLNVVVTGAAAGLGRALTLALSQAGAKLAAIDVNEQALSELKPFCQGGVHVADVSDSKRMQEIAQQILQTSGSVDVVIANAGVGGLNPGYDFSIDVSAKTTAINVNGLVNSLAPFIPAMLQQRRGQLVGVSSMASFRGLPNAASYSATKAAQRVMLESLRVDLRSFNIAVSCICPGFVQTAMTEHDEFPMPFMVPVDKAARLMLRAIAKKRSLYLFPWQMRWLTYLNRLLPNFVFDRLIPILSKATTHKRARVF
jgi:short-subunit dehydrogenase